MFVLSVTRGQQHRCVFIDAISVGSYILNVVHLKWNYVQHFENDVYFCNFYIFINDILLYTWSTDYKFEYCLNIINGHII